MNKKILFLFLLIGILIFPFFAQAQALQGYITNVAKVLKTVALILAVVCWLISAIMFFTAAGDPGRIGAAKKVAYAAIAGTVIVILASAATGMIDSALKQGI